MKAAEEEDSSEGSVKEFQGLQSIDEIKKSQRIPSDETTNSRSSHGRKRLPEELAFFQRWRYALLGISILFLILIMSIVMVVIVMNPGSESKSIPSSARDRDFLPQDPREPLDSDSSDQSAFELSTTSVPGSVPRIPMRSRQPISAPSSQLSPNPSPDPSASPTHLPSQGPTWRPTSRPSSSPTLPPYRIPGRTIFYAIGDVPYSPREATSLAAQVLGLSPDAEFLIHVGDIRSAEEGLPCMEEEYTAVDLILRNSSVPVFVVPGDNEWNDCPNVDRGWELYSKTFVGYESKHWTHNFDVLQQPGRPENFAFAHKGSLFIGLNIVGGKVHNGSEWLNRLSGQAGWTMDLIRQHMLPTVIFGHADPLDAHRSYFVAIQEFIQNELENNIPILYVNGDKHQWGYSDAFYSQESWKRIMLTGGVSEPPLKISVNPLEIMNLTFQYDRQL